MNGERIANMRDELGLTQSELASIVGVHAMSVSKWERDVAVPPSWQEGLLVRFESASRRMSMARIVRVILLEEGPYGALRVLLTNANLSDDSRRLGHAGPG